MKNEIERIEKISKADFLDKYVHAQKPVIFTNLFEGQPLDKLRTEEQIQQAFGEMRIRIFETYEETVQRAIFGILMGQPDIASPEPEEMTLNEYLEMIRRGESETKLCSESPPSLWGDFEDSFDVPDYCCDDDGKPLRYIPELWLGRDKHYTHLHYDTDGRNILLHQIYGTKRVIIAPPESSKKFASAVNISLLCPENLSDNEWEDWVQFIGGWQTILQPGETIFTPAYFWHSVEYHSNSMSVVMRHRDNGLTKKLYENLPPNFKTQAISAKFVNEDAVSECLREKYDRIIDACKFEYSSAIKKDAGIAEVVDAVYSELWPDEAGKNYARPFVSKMMEVFETSSLKVGSYQSLRFDQNE